MQSVILVKCVILALFAQPAKIVHRPVRPHKIAGQRPAHRPGADGPTACSRRASSPRRSQAAVWLAAAQHRARSGVSVGPHWGAGLDGVASAAPSWPEPPGSPRPAHRTEGRCAAAASSGVPAVGQVHDGEPASPGQMDPLPDPAERLRRAQPKRPAVCSAAFDAPDAAGAGPRGPPTGFPLRWPWRRAGPRRTTRPRSSRCTLWASPTRGGVGAAGPDASVAHRARPGARCRFRCMFWYGCVMIDP